VLELVEGDGDLRGAHWVPRSPHLAEAAALRNACAFATRILGFINAPAIWQLVASSAPDATVDIAAYQEKRDLLCAALTSAGYEVEPPQGSYYVFPKTPIADDIEFIGHLQREGILAVPGTGFGRPGYFRLSLTIPRGELLRSLPGFGSARNTSCLPPAPSRRVFQ
jgi:aspartate aminotransferase